MRGKNLAIDSTNSHEKHDPSASETGTPDYPTYRITLPFEPRRG